MAKKSSAKSKAGAAVSSDAAPPSVPKDEVAMKEATVPAAETAASTPVTGSKSKGKKSSATDGVKQVDGMPASGGSGRKVRITEESPAQAIKRRASAGAGSPDGPASKGKKSAKNGAVNGEDTSMLVDDLQTAAPAADPKFSPKHKDKARGLPEKSALKKQKKRKADDEADAGADESTVEEAETSMAALSTSDEAEDDEGGEIDFLAGFESGSDDADEDGADSSDDETAQSITTKDLPKPKETGKKATDSKKKAGKAKKDEVGLVSPLQWPFGVTLLPSAWCDLSWPSATWFPRR